MQVYTIHLRRQGLDPHRDIVLVKEGFCWPAMVFTGVWALWHRMWLPALVIIAISIISGGLLRLVGADQLTQFLASSGIAVGVGLLANDMRRGALERNGFTQGDIVCGDGDEAALLQFMQTHPGILEDA